MAVPPGIVAVAGAATLIAAMVAVKPRAASETFMTEMTAVIAVIIALPVGIIEKTVTGPIATAIRAIIAIIIPIVMAVIVAEKTVLGAPR